MALNFPPVDAADGNPTNGMLWTAPDGHQWQYDSSIPGWRTLAATGNSNIIYRGGLDLTQDPLLQYDPIDSGNQFVVTVGDDPVDGGLYPGLGGKTVAEGAIAMYDGNQWQVTSNLPYATESQAGIVELADVSEALNLGNTIVAMTPSKTSVQIDYKIQQASTTIVGKTRYATQVEAAAGTETEAALTPASIQELIEKVNRLEVNIVDSGMIMWVTAQKQVDIPAGWLFCDGRRIYEDGETAELYRKLSDWGNPWGNSPTSDVVRIPDLRGRFIRGWHDGEATDPDQASYGAAVEDSFKSHTHSVNDPGHNHKIPGNGYNEAANQEFDRVLIDNNYNAQLDRQSENQTSLTGVSLDSTGGSETKPKNISLTPVIKL